MPDDMTNAKGPLVSVIVEGYNESHEGGREGLYSVEDTIDALKQQHFPLNEVEVILFGDEIQAIEWKERYSYRSPFLHVKTIGVNDAHYYELKNMGAQIARGEILAFTDSDVCPKPTWLASIVAAIRDGADVVVGPSLYRTKRDPHGDTVLMQVAASITWGFIVGKGSRKELPVVRGLAAHNVGVRARILRQTHYRTDFGRTLGSPLIFTALTGAGARIVLRAEQQVTHSFSLRWWLFRLHPRFGHEAFWWKRLDKSSPNQWIARGRVLEPLLHMGWLILLDIPRWIRFSKLLGVGLHRRLGLLPIVIAMSFAARGAEMVGMYATMLAPKAVKEWAETT